MNRFSIKTKVNALTVSCLVAGLTVAWVFLGWMRMDDKRDLGVLTLHLRQMELSSVQQVNFKKQVQEWKDILLNGRNAEDFEKYRGLFLEQESLVQKDGKTLAGSLTQSPIRAKADEFLQAHEELGRRYRNALRVFEQSGRLDYQSADRMVRGMDRGPADLLGEIAGSLANDFDHYLTSHDAAVLNAQLYAVGASLFVFLGLMVASMLVARRITRPIYNLAQTVAKVSTGKDYSVRAVRSSRDELGLLADGFNEMLAQIQARDTALQSANDNLEQRVGERTKELATSLSLLNATLESTTEGILAVEASGKVISCNNKFAKMWQVPPELMKQLDGVPLLAFTSTQVKDPQKFLAWIGQTQAHPEAEAFDLLELKDGRIFEHSALPRWIDGKCVGSVLSVRDITERKLVEAALEKANQELVVASRLAGMAEIVTGVLHNVGNVLNSVGVSATLVANQVRHTKAVNIAKLAALFDQHKADLAGFLATDPRGQTIPAYLGSLAESLAAEQTTLLAELAYLRKNIEHIKDIVAMQQAYAQTSGGTATISIPDLLEEALHINADALARYNVATIRDYQACPAIITDKHKVLQILINLVRNAKLACVDSGRTDKQITVRTTSDDRSVKIAIIDNGVGVPAENLARIFNHGFTTREHGHGFALHSGALAAKELGGSLSVQSGGPGKGAVFTLEIPIAAPQPPA